ncbi:efflux RND transporter periplasmic adaptor subunit [Lysobacter solisilvae (ex Woo and Kim 2020)]|uniref:Efflux RND transporter periplasmic adaptor subunit n=1 Tax=Agrilutibacter terrestris TaxID=2865112 RepID=A0A7H0FYY8_9GAMM|nr:efflux RND transporter periplasmic adaptor subunit [Lysobacter terrestris]QNP41254.1 efflux RND transporter periplasmic adaptor subunit [Lysobacter terrestris]
MSAARKPSPVRKSSSSLRRVAVAAVALAVVIGGVYLWRHRSNDEAASAFRTAKVERGDIRVTISATGALNATSQVDVGSQISGQVTDVLVDYNDRVSKGQVIARIDPSTYEAQIAQGNAQINSARAGLATAEATLRNAEADYNRKAELATQQLIARGDLDLARAARDQARAQVASAQAQIRQQTASTQTTRLNLQRTVIRSPVDGVVLSRSIEPGQTVAASLQAPVLFQIAEDLSQMEILLAVDEADIGQVKPGLDVDFTVDAYPERRFRGKVKQVRLAATNTSNVITYPVVVSLDNADQALLPGMTANAEIEVSHREDVLRVSNAALRYKPDQETAGTGAGEQAGGNGRGNFAEDFARIATTLKLDARQQAAFDEALAAIRQRAAARQAAPAQQSGASLFGRGPGGPGGGGNRSGAGGGNAGAMRQRMAERFNQQFAAFKATLAEDQRAQWDKELAALLGSRRAPLYKLVDGKPQAVTVRVGASDGSNTEVSGDIREGEEVIVGSGRAAK